MSVGGQKKISFMLNTVMVVFESLQVSKKTWTRKLVVNSHWKGYFSLSLSGPTPQLLVHSHFTLCCGNCQFISLYLCVSPTLLGRYADIMIFLCIVLNTNEVLCK